MLKASLKSTKEGGLGLAGARSMAQALNPDITDFLVRDIVAYNVIRIFHAPMDWPEGDGASWAQLPDSTSEYTATLTGDLTKYLESASTLGRLAKDPVVREKVEEIVKRSSSNSTFLVIEERGRVDGCTMDRGECWPGPARDPDSVVVFNLAGGAWPDFSEQVERDTELLAALRIITKTDHPFELHARSVCFVTDAGETAHLANFEAKVAYGGARSMPRISEGEVSRWADQVAHRVKRLRRASADPAVSELLSAIRLDKARSEEYFRLWYLRLWQALRDTGEFCTSAKVKSHLATLQPQQRWKDLTKHRNAIAHWETARVEYEKVADLHRFAVEVLDYVATVTKN